MDISKQLAYYNYQRLGFPVEILRIEREAGAVNPEALVTWPGWGAGFFVIDVDAEKGGLASFKNLQKAIPLPKTVTTKTQSGGYHYYFAYPDGYYIDSQVEWLPGIDILAENGRVTLPPTRGEKTGRRYEWLHSPFSTAMAAPPRNLLYALNAQKI